MKRLFPALLILCAVAASAPSPGQAPGQSDDYDEDGDAFHGGHYCRHYSPTGKLIAHAVPAGGEAEGADKEDGDDKAVDLVMGADPEAFHRPEPWNESDKTEGRPRVLAGSCFAVSVVEPFSGKTAAVGNEVSARLAADLKVRGVTVAPRGSLVRGHVFNVEAQRNEIKADLSSRRRGHAGAAVGLLFTEVVGSDGKVVPLDAAPAAGSHVLSATGADVLMVVDKEGNITGSLSPTVKGDAVSLAVTGASLAAGPIGFAIAPIANAVVGAVKPEYELHRGAGSEEHPRMKGFAEGLVNGLPGAFLWSGAAKKGDPVDVLPGYQLLLELKKDLEAP